MTAIDNAAADRIRATAQLPLPQAERAQRIAAAIRKATGHRWVGIYAVAAGEIRNLAWSGPAPPAHPSFPADAGLTAAAIQTRAPVVSGDVGGDARYLQALPTTASEMIIPIVVDGAVVGTLDVESDLPDAFGAADRMALARIAAALVSIARPHDNGGRHRAWTQRSSEDHREETNVDADDHRVQFDFEVEFLTGGGLQGQGFRLDIVGDDICDDELAATLVRDLRLLMVGDLSRAQSRARYAPDTEFQIGQLTMCANTGTYLDSRFTATSTATTWPPSHWTAWRILMR